MRRNPLHNGYYLWIDIEQSPDHLMFKIWPIFYYQTKVLLASYPVGKNWVYNFFGYCDELKTTYSRRYNYERALYEDLNKTGSAIGLTITAKVVTRADLYGKGPHKGLVSRSRDTIELED